MQQPMNTNPVQVVFVTQPEAFYRQDLYKNMKNGLARQLIGLGASQVVIGSLCIIFQAVAVGIYTNSIFFSLDFVGHGFWTGILFVIAGAFGIAGGRKRSRCPVVAFNVLSILSASFAACLLSIAIPGAIMYASRSYNCYYDDSYYHYYSSSRCNGMGMRDTGTTMEALMAILALAEGIIAIWSSVICCKIGACCCNCCTPSPLHNQFVMAGQPYPGQQQIPLANQQPQMFLVNQPPPFSPNLQQPTYLPNHHQQQQPNINLYPRQQMAQYSPQQPNLPPYIQQSSDHYTELSPDHGSCTELYTGLANANIDPLQHANPGGAPSAYDNI